MDTAAMADAESAHGQRPPGIRLPTYLQSFLYLRHRHRFLPAMRARFGDAFRLRVPPYADDLVIFGGPDAIGQIFHGSPRQYHAGEGNQILGFVMGEHSVLIVDEDAHRRIRGLLMPAFNGAALRGYQSMITERTRADVSSWSPGSEIPMLAAMNRLTLEIILSVVFGVTDPRVKSELVQRLRSIINIPPLIFVGCRYPALKRIPPWKGFAENQERIDEILYREIASRRQISDLGGRSDVLSRLLAVGAVPGEVPLSDAELRDQLISLLLAGHETTAAALTWTLWELARRPELQSTARAAAISGDTKYLEAVFKEGLRCHTVIASTARKLTEPAVIAGRQIDIGTVVNTSIILAHNDPRNHPEPQEFRPERFLGANPPPNTWLPFGGGVRRCLGAGFATTEATIILSEVLTRWELSAVRDDESPYVRNITTVPRHQAVLRLKPTESRGS